jgi:antitoxin ParD1/3/4
MAGRNFSLTPRLSLFVDRQVGSGRHQNASEVVREALRRYEAALVEEKTRIAAIRAAIREGREDIAGGDYTLVETAEDEGQLYADLTGRQSARRRIHTASRG